MNMLFSLGKVELISLLLWRLLGVDVYFCAHCDQWHRIGYVYF